MEDGRITNFKKPFLDGMEYEEWAALQDQNSLEFRAIAFSHTYNPDWALEDIQKDMYDNYIKTMANQKTHVELFGAPSSDPYKLNQTVDRIIKILNSPSEYKSVDSRGHGTIITAKFGGRGKDAEQISFRVEEKASRQAHYLIDHKIVSTPTVSDFVREAFVKYMEIYPFINEIHDTNTNNFLVDMWNERKAAEKRDVKAKLDAVEDRLKEEERSLQDALRHIDNREELIEFRDETTEFIINMLSSLGTKKYKNAVKDFIMKNSSLYNILSILEREGLVTKEYIENVTRKGKVIVNLPKTEKI